MIKKALAVLLLLTGPATYACTTCNRTLQDALFNSTFYPNLLVMLLAFIVLGAIVAALVWIAKRLEKYRRARHPDVKSMVPLSCAATILGIGLGGFIDGVVLHQILQWHEMLSNKIPPDTLLNKSVNMFWDGIFHAFCLLVTLTGVYLLFGVLRKPHAALSYKLLNGGLLLGWGLFNLVEGVIDHQLLKLHNVREITDNVLAWNYGFLVFSLLLIAAGTLLISRQIKAAS